MLITFEGIDGVGKTSLMEGVYDILIDEGYIAIKTREPGGSDRAERWRERFINTATLEPRSTRMLLEFLLLSRKYNIIDTMHPAFMSNRIILSNRYRLSMYVYQCRMGNLLKSFATERELLVLKYKPPRPLLTFLLTFNGMDDLRIIKGRSFQPSGIANYADSSDMNQGNRINNIFIDEAKKYSSRVIIVNALHNIKVNVQRVADVIISTYNKVDIRSL